jgi:redox-sensitive bicupin YhaK (pirin superfamily)
VCTPVSSMVTKARRWISVIRAHAYVHLARGSLQINGQRLAAGDGARLRDETAIEITAGEVAEVLIFDLRADSAAHS